MPLVSGPITPHGAIIDILSGVRQTRMHFLEAKGLPVPEPVPVRAVIDTGAAISGITSKVFCLLNIEPVAKIHVVTPSTPIDEPHECDQYFIGLSLVADGRSHYLADLRVMETSAWLPDEGFEALIGRDILQQCFFQYIGQERKFTLAF